MRSVEDDELACFPFTFLDAGSCQLGLKPFDTGGLELDSLEGDPRDGNVGPFRDAQADLCWFCFLFFRSPTVSFSGSAQDTSNMMGLDTRSV